MPTSNKIYISACWSFSANETVLVKRSKDRVVQYMQYDLPLSPSEIQTRRIL